VGNKGALKPQGLNFNIWHHWSSLQQLQVLPGPKSQQPHPTDVVISKPLMLKEEPQTQEDSGEANLQSIARVDSEEACALAPQQSMKGMSSPPICFIVRSQNNSRVVRAARLPCGSAVISAYCFLYRQRTHRPSSNRIHNPPPPSKVSSCPLSCKGGAGRFRSLWDRLL